MGWFYEITLCLLALKMCMACPVSRTTLAYVPSCPKSLEEWRIRAEFKRCSLVRQNCTSPQKFVYHCVINNFDNATMEVCAQETLIIDNRCAEFNIKAGIILESYTKQCKGFCPFKYNSTEAYKLEGKNGVEEKTLLKNKDKKKSNNSLEETKAQRGKEVILYSQCKSEETDAFIIAIDIGEKYYGLAHTDLSNPQVIISSHPMERIAVLIEKPNTIKMVGKDATNKFIEMKAEDIRHHVYVNEIKPDKLGKKVPETELTYLKLFTAATLGVIKRIEDEICEEMKNIKDVRVVFSAGCHWREPVKDLIDDVLVNARESLNWQEGHEKVAFIEKVETVSQFIRASEAASYCLNLNVENLKLKSKKYAVLNVGFGSCHLTFLHYLAEKHFDIRDSGGRTRRDWNEALPEDKVWSLCKEMIDEKYINQQNHVRVINQYENLHERIRMCRDDETVFEFSFPGDVFKENFRKIAEEKGIEIQRKDKSIIIMLKWFLLKTFFKELKETVNDVIEKNKEDFKKLEIECVFLIGGYSIMKMIQDAAKNEWFKHKTVMIPDDAGVCYAVGGATAGARGVIEFDATG